MSQDLYVVDAFAKKPFSGNPAAVCMLARWPSASWMQAVAAEMNLSETAFLLGRSTAYELRWFTPLAEVDLCGHATLASAHVLWESGRAPRNEALIFTTRSGELRTLERDGWIEMDFPSDPPAVVDDGAPLASALGATPRWTGKGKLYDFVEVDDEATLRGLEPDYEALARAARVGVCVTAPADGGEFDLVSRFFAPAVGIPEDPVTGSAHCLLAPYWAERLGKDELLAYQASPRGGVIRLRVGGDRTVMSGQAVTVSHGQLVLDPELETPTQPGGCQEPGEK